MTISAPPTLDGEMFTFRWPNAAASNILRSSCSTTFDLSAGGSSDFSSISRASHVLDRGAINCCDHALDVQPHVCAGSNSVRPGKDRFPALGRTGFEGSRTADTATGGSDPGSPDCFSRSASMDEPRSCRGICWPGGRRTERNRIARRCLAPGGQDEGASGCRAASSPDRVGRVAGDGQQAGNVAVDSRGSGRSDDRAPVVYTYGGQSATSAGAGARRDRASAEWTAPQNPVKSGRDRADPGDFDHRAGHADPGDARADTHG